MPFSRAELYAHRGLSLEHPENTLEAFEAAARQGARWIETDVRTTADGVVLIFHDSTLNRVAGRPGRIDELTFEQVREVELAGGARIPTLREALDRFPDLSFNIDVKDDASAAALPAVVVGAGAGQRVRIASFSEKRRSACLREFATLAPGLRVKSSAAVEGTTLFSLVCRTVPAAWPLVARLAGRWVEPFDSLQVPRHYRVLGRRVPVVTPRFLATAHRFGLEVHVWTIDDPEQMRELLELGADGIVTNRSDLFNREQERSAA